jgi:hypothetical protein
MKVKRDFYVAGNYPKNPPANAITIFGYATGGRPSRRAEEWGAAGGQV